MKVLSLGGAGAVCQKAAYDKNIAIPLSIGAQMIARGDVTHRGVTPPETAIDPEIFFAESARRRIEIHETVQEIQQRAS